MIETRSVGISFGGIVAVEDISLSVAGGEVFGLLGPNGAGKTTLFNLIAGAAALQSGSILLGGKDVSRLRPDARSRAGIARTFQITRPFADLTIAENIMVGMLQHRAPLPSMRAEAGRLAEQVGLAAKLHSPAKELSTGQRKRLELARALATRPRVLLLDEITGGVDEASIGGLVDLVLLLKGSGMAIIVVEHNVGVMRSVADRVLFMNRGRSVAQGLPDEVMAHADVIELYLGTADA